MSNQCPLYPQKRTLALGCLTKVAHPHSLHVRAGNPEQRPLRYGIVEGIDVSDSRAHNRMPLILAAGDYARWLSDELDPRDLLRPFPAEPMRMWPISTRVNKPENDDPSIVEPVALAGSAA
jgi:SOS response associated peptidase (SRAP)